MSYSDNQMYSQVIQETGARGVSSDKQTAIQNGIKDSLNYIWNYHPWSWRRRRMTVRVTASTPYYACPSDFDSLLLTELERENTTDGNVYRIVQRTDADFWKADAGADAQIPLYFRVAMRTVGSTPTYCVELTPPADGVYEWPNTEYLCTAPTLTFSSSTPVTPLMPPEFYGTWKTAAVSHAAKALGRYKLSGFLVNEADRDLGNAVKRHDKMVVNGPPRGLEDPYGDAALLL